MRGFKFSQQILAAVITLALSISVSAYTSKSKIINMKVIYNGVAVWLGPDAVDGSNSDPSQCGDDVGEYWIDMDIEPPERQMILSAVMAAHFAKKEIELMISSNKCNGLRPIFYGLKVH